MKNGPSLPSSPLANGEISTEQHIELSTSPAYCRACEAGDWPLVRVIAFCFANKTLDADAQTGAEILIERERRHKAASDLVAIWARATGRTGGAHKQSRQNHIRRLLKRGISSDYARKMMLEAGLVCNMERG